MGDPRTDRPPSQRSQGGEVSATTEVTAPQQVMPTHISTSLTGALMAMYRTTVAAQR